MHHAVRKGSGLSLDLPILQRTKMRVIPPLDPAAPGN